MSKKSFDLVIPIYYGNLKEIEKSVNKVYNFLDKNMKAYDWNIIIGLNGSNKNGILELCKKIVSNYKNTKLIYTLVAGRGASLSSCWLASKSNYVSYMDVDLSTDLKFFPLMIKELEKGFSLCIGSRYLESSKKKRSFFRYFISIVYNHFFLKFLLDAKFTDSQCGFKSMDSVTAKKIIPLIKDVNWFWDTELLYICQKKGFNLKEIPIIWNEQPNSGVKFLKTIMEFITKSFELRFRKF